MNLIELIKNSNTTIVDVRTKEEFSKESLNYTINIPLSDIIDRVNELKKMQPLVLCCLSGVRSGKATEYLKSIGFEKVYNGGGWREIASYRLCK